MLIKRHRDGFTLIVVCACLFFCSGLVISYYRFYYQQALTYHRLSSSWIHESQDNLNRFRNSIINSQ